MKLVVIAMATMLAAMATACTKGPEPIRWGLDMCDQCRMILVDKRFAAELVGSRVYKFDGLDELARFQASHPETKGTPYVTDGETGNLVPSRQAAFLASADLKGPMGAHVMAFGNRQGAEQFAAQHQLHDVRWLTEAEALRDAGGGTDAGH